MGNGSLSLPIENAAALPVRKWLRTFLPFLSWMPELKTTWKKDLFAGLTGAVVVLPQGVAFAMIAGLPAQYGLYTAIVPAVIAALFGSSRHLISGPTTAISLVIFSSIGALATPGSEEYIKLVFLLTFLVGLFQYILGVARLGALINFVSHSVVIGFTAGAAVLIAMSQMKHIFGLSFKNAPHFIDNIKLLIQNLHGANYYSVAITAVTVLVILAIRKIKPAWPSMLMGMMTGGIVTVAMGWHNQGVRVVGALPSPVPPFEMPAFSLDAISTLTTPALAIAMMGLMEAVSIARSVALQSGQRINGNREFIGQGLSNMIGSFFSSYASSGSFTRTGVNYRAGAATAASGIFASLWLFAILFFVAPLAAYLPIASMAGVILIVAYNLIDFHHIRSIFKISTTEAVILMVTFLSTLFLELEFAIYVGAFLSIAIYLNKTSSPRVTPRVPETGTRQLVNISSSIDRQCPQIGIATIDGDLYFAAMTSVEEQIACLHSKTPSQTMLLLVLSSVNHIDVAGIDSLQHMIREWRTKNGDIYFYGIKWPLMNILYQSGIYHEIGADNIFKDKETAIETLVAKVDISVCTKCTKRIFWECDKNKCLATQHEHIGTIQRDCVAVPG